MLEVIFSNIENFCDFFKEAFTTNKYPLMPSIISAFMILVGIWFKEYLVNRFNKKQLNKMLKAEVKICLDFIKNRNIKEHLMQNNTTHICVPYFIEDDLENYTLLYKKNLDKIGLLINCEMYVEFYSLFLQLRKNIARIEEHKKYCNEYYKTYSVYQNNITQEFFVNTANYIHKMEELANEIKYKTQVF